MFYHEDPPNNAWIPHADDLAAILQLQAKPVRLAIPFSASDSSNGPAISSFNDQRLRMFLPLLGEIAAFSLEASAKGATGKSFC
jgi:hypothetical protein